MQQVRAPPCREEIVPTTKQTGLLVLHPCLGVCQAIARGSPGQRFGCKGHTTLRVSSFGGGRGARLGEPGHPSQRRLRPAQVAWVSGQVGGTRSPRWPSTVTSVNGAVTAPHVQREPARCRTSSSGGSAEHLPLPASDCACAAPSLRGARSNAGPGERGPLPGRAPAPRSWGTAGRPSLSGPAEPVCFCFPVRSKGLLSPPEGNLTAPVIPCPSGDSVTFLGAAAQSRGSN